MIEKDRYCVEILDQTLAIRSALAQVEMLVLQDDAGDRAEEAVASEDPDAQRRELVDVVEKVCR